VGMVGETNLLASSKWTWTAHLRKSHLRPTRQRRGRCPRGNRVRGAKGARPRSQSCTRSRGRIPPYLQPGEPQDRFQGATNLRRARWSKPPKSGGTTRAERVRNVASPGRRCLRAACGSLRRPASRSSSELEITRSGHLAQMPMEGRIYDNPMRGAQVQQDRTRQASRPVGSKERTNGQRIPDGVSEGEAKVRRAGPLVDPTPRRARAGSPSQAHFSSTEGKKRSRRASGEGQRSTTRAGVGHTVLRPRSQWRRGQQP
jgi:hypothetical protein